VTTGTIFQIERFAIHDGPGIRTTVFFKGCPLRCWWCHSPQSQSPHAELLLRPDRCLTCGTCVVSCEQQAIGPDGAGGFVTDMARCEACGACTRVCPCGARELIGRPVTVAELVHEIERDVVFFDESGGGVTFSGGEPLLQSQFLLEVLGECRARGIHCAVETCGLTDRETLLAVAQRTDLILFDVKFLDEARHRTFTGVSNRPILANLETLAKLGARVRVRFPLIPGVNDDRATVDGLGQLAAALGLPCIDVLPYHKAGLARYERLHRDYRLTGVEPPSTADLDAIVHRLAGYGLQVHAGG
jgi:pyruvate formate lyase activating enzyme